MSSESESLVKAFTYVLYGFDAEVYRPDHLAPPEYVGAWVLKNYDSIITALSNAESAEHSAPRTNRLMDAFVEKNRELEERCLRAEEAVAAVQTLLEKSGDNDGISTEELKTALGVGD